MGGFLMMEDECGWGFAEEREVKGKSVNTLADFTGEGVRGSRGDVGFAKLALEELRCREAEGL